VADQRAGMNEMDSIGVFLSNGPPFGFSRLTPHSRFVWVLLLHRDQSRLAFTSLRLNHPSTRIPLLKSFFFHPQNVFHGSSRPRTARHPTRCPRLKPRWRRTRR
jgi:hypothetical protein